MLRILYHVNRGNEEKLFYNNIHHKLSVKLFIFHRQFVYRILYDMQHR